MSEFPITNEVVDKSYTCGALLRTIKLATQEIDGDWKSSDINVAIADVCLCLEESLRLWDDMHGALEIAHMRHERDTNATREGTSQ